jgi:acetoin utilization deacetylase AcuC-like enzyme
LHEPFMNGNEVVIIDPQADGKHFSPGHPERPERVAAVRKALAALQSPAISFASAEQATMFDIAMAHTPDYINGIEATRASSGGWLDADTYVTPDSYDAAMFSAGAAMAAVDVAYQGRHAFALTRPPGHHASADRAMGFCLFNNVVIAAMHALTLEGIERVAIVDIDVHHGNGTQDLVEGNEQILFVSLHEHEKYFFPASGGIDDNHGNIHNIPLPAGTDSKSWLHAFDAQAEPVIKAFQPDMILVSCGFDALASDPLADLKLTADVYGDVAERLTKLSNRPTVWCLEGGYDPPAIAQAASGLVQALAKREMGPKSIG